MTINLKARTLELFKARSRELTIKIIADETGLPEGWLSMFGQDRMKNPGVNSVQALHEYLAKEPLLKE